MQKASAAWALMKSLKNGTVRSVLSAWVRGCNNELTSGSGADKPFSLSIDSLACSTTNTRRSFSSGRLSAPFVGSVENALVAWCLIHTWCTTPELNSDRRSCHCAKVPVVFAEFSVLRMDSWSVCMVNQVPSRYGSCNNTNSTIATLVSEWDGCPVLILLMN